MCHTDHKRARYAVTTDENLTSFVEQGQIACFIDEIVVNSGRIGHWGAKKGGMICIVPPSPQELIERSVDHQRARSGGRSEESGVRIPQASSLKPSYPASADPQMHAWRDWKQGAAVSVSSWGLRVRSSGPPSLQRGAGGARGTYLSRFLPFLAPNASFARIIPRARSLKGQSCASRSDLQNTRSSRAALMPWCRQSALPAPRQFRRKRSPR